MIIEDELKKLLEINGFEPKKTKGGSIWTYNHEKYMVVNFHLSRTVSFNYLGKYMRDEVKKMHGSLIGLSPAKKEELYRKALSKLDFYKNINNENYISFSLRAKEGGDYVGILDKVGMEVFEQILNFILNDSKKKYRSQATNVSTKNDEFLPNKSYIERAIECLLKTKNESPSRDEILNQIEKMALSEKKTLKENWREITKRNIAIWLGK